MQQGNKQQELNESFVLCRSFHFFHECIIHNKATTQPISQPINSGWIIQDAYIKGGSNRRVMVRFTIHLSILLSCDCLEAQLFARYGYDFVLSLKKKGFKLYLYILLSFLLL
jgi:hypothetical protein